MYYPQKSNLIIITSLVTLISGLMVMTGRWFNITILEQLLPQFTSLKFNTALCLVFISICLFLTQLSAQKYVRVAFIAIASIIILFGFATILQYLLHFNIGIDEFFVKDVFDDVELAGYPGRMAISTASCISLFGITYLLFAVNTGWCLKTGQYLLHLITSISAISIIGYLYCLSVLYKTNSVNTMSVPTAILFLCLSIAASLLHPQYGFTNLFTGNKVGNLMARRLFLPLVAIIMILGVFTFEVNNLFFLPGIGLFLLAALVLLIIGITAKNLNIIDEQRANAKNEVLALNTSLEKRAEERSQALLKTFVKLEASEKKYRSLIEHASDAIYTLDPEGNFTEVNASMCKMTGYTREELLTLRIEDVIDPEQLKFDPIVYDPKDLNNAIIRERRFIKKNGQVFHVEVNIKRFSEDRVLVIARDITERKLMETVLREAELKFRILAERSVVGVYIVQKGKFIYVNPRFAKIFGYTQQELIDKPVEIIISDDYKSISLEHVRARLAGEVESVHYEAIGQCKSGATNWVEFYGSSIHLEGEPTIMGSMIDITERKKAEEQLRLSEQKYKLLFDSNPLPMWMVAKESLSFIAANQSAINTYGYTQDEFLKLTVKDIRLEEDWGILEQSYRQKPPASGNLGIFRHRKKDGSIIQVQIITREITFEGKQVRLSLANNVTERIKSEELLQKSEANLQTILNTTDTAYALFDKKLNVLVFNQMAAKFVQEQYNHTPQKGDKLKDYFPAERFPQFNQFTKQVLEGNDISYEIDYPQPDRTVCWYYVRLFPIVDNNKQILGLMMALYDITSRKNAENDLRMAYQRIQDQINNIKHITWKQSHYIRSPLANLKGLTDILKDDPTNAKTLDYILIELDRLDAVIVEMEKDASGYQDQSEPF